MSADRSRARAVTRADVARYSGVSTAVVSYVLNNGPKRVSPETRERVLDAVRTLGYRPNAAARALSTGSADMIGMLVPDARNPFFAQLCHAVDQACIEQRRSLLIVNTDREQVSTAAQIRDLSARQLGGLVVADVLGANEQALIESVNMPVVLINQYDRAPGLPSLGADFREGARQAVAHLIEHGYRDIAFIGSADRLDQRERGWSDALTAAGVPLGPTIHSPFSYDAGFQAGVTLAASDRMPRAAFAASDQIAVGLLAGLHSRGVNVPEDIAVAAFDGTTEAQYTWPPLTTAAQPFDDMARAAITQLLGGETSAGYQAFSTQLTIRQSCGCPPSP